MSVVPAELDRVGPNRLHALDLQVRANRGRVEHALAGPFIPASCTRAFAPEQVIKYTVDAVVRPGQFEDLVSLKGPDICGRIGH